MSLDPELGSLSMPQTLNRYVYCVNNPLKYVDPDGMRFYWEPFDRRKPATPEETEDIVTFLGFVPYADTISDIYFGYQYAQEGNWLMVAVTAGLALVPYVNMGWFKGGSKFVKWLDDTPTPPPRAPLRSVQGEDFYRYMTRAEHEKMLSTGTDGKYLLKTLSSEGETYFSPSRYSSYPEVKSLLGAGQSKSLRVHFRVVNDPVISKAGIARYYSGTPIPHGGIELASKGDIWVEILDVSRLLKYPVRGV